MSSRRELYSRGRAALSRGADAMLEAAQCMAELYELGDTHREIATQLGIHNTTVGRYLKALDNLAASGSKLSSSAFAAELTQGQRASNENRVAIPKTAEAKAELVAGLLKDKKVADAPAVRQVQERHADRRLRAEVAEFNRGHGIPTRTQTERENRRQSVVRNDIVWRRWEATINLATQALNDAAGQVERTGLPRSGSGAVIKAARALRRAADRFEEAASSAGIGKAM